MSDPTQTLKSFHPTKEFFIGIDSDGCVFDSMEIKHKECFAPMFIKHFGLQTVSKYAREVWEFVNLYSKTRGCNRFQAISRALDLMRNHPETLTRNVDVPTYPELDEWMINENKLSNAALYAEIDRGNDALIPIRKWSDAVNTQVEHTAQGVPPFPLVYETFEKMATLADCAVVSQTPTEALEREWAENNLKQFVQLVAGQEVGTKTQHLEYMTNGKYEAGKTLMIGDAPGDQKAASDNNAFFFPINPGSEEACWYRLHNEALERFFSGTYGGNYQQELINEFQTCLPEAPPW